MKTRRLMAIVAGAAVMTWLAIPAVRIWLDPGLLRHDHVMAAPEGKVVNIRIKPPLLVPGLNLSGRAVTVSHSTSFARRYRAMLLGRRWSDEEACGLGRAISIESIADESKPMPPFQIMVLNQGTLSIVPPSRKPVGPLPGKPPKKGFCG